MIDPVAQRLARRLQIPALVERALRDAGVVDVFPTPLTAIHEIVGIEQVVDMSGLPEPVAVKKPSRWGRILGALLFHERTIFVDFSQGETRSNFTEAHETAHRLIPWHEQSFLLDHEDTLFRDVREELEDEASYGGTALIFQNGRFHRRALKLERSIQTPILLAPDYRASMHVTIRHYVEGHPEPVALLIAGRFAPNGVLPVWCAVESDSFRARHGVIGRFFPAGLPINDQSSVAELAREAFKSPAEPPSCRVPLPDLSRAQRPFIAEAFFNQHCLFVMFSPRTRVPTGRRVAVRVAQ